MGRCGHYAHEYFNGVWVGRLSRGIGPQCWEPCAVGASPPPPDGVLIGKFRCSRCQETLEVLGVFRYFPKGGGYFFSALDQDAMSADFHNHLDIHRARNESAALVPVREEEME